MPDNFEEPSHRLMRETAARGSWAGKLAASAKRVDRQSAGWYYGKLRNLTTRVDVWRTIYHHPLQGGAAIVEWFKGTGLRPFLDPLTEHEQKSFLLQYEAAIAQAYPAFPDGTVLLPFPRLFIVATR
jgi:trans-aconitate 2-methyltransferase